MYSKINTTKITVSRKSMGRFWLSVSFPEFEPLNAYTGNERHAYCEGALAGGDEERERGRGACSCRSGLSHLVDLLGFRHRGHLYPRTAACARLRFDSHLPAHPLRAMFDDGQADAGACVSFYRMQPLKRQEDALKMLAVHSNAVVLHPEPNRGAALLGPEPHPRGSAGRDKLERVIQQIDQDFLQHLGVCPHFWQRANDLYCSILALDWVSQLRKSSFDSLLQAQSPQGNFDVTNPAIIQ